LEGLRGDVPAQVGSFRKLVVGITGASGVVYAYRFLTRCSEIRRKYSDVYVIYTENSIEVFKQEIGSEPASVFSSIKCVSTTYHAGDWSSPLASSSNLIDTDCVIVPASLNTIAKLANGIQDNLLLRVASSINRLKGKLVIVLRETPLSSIDLENLYKLSINGAVILPASPAFYIKPTSIDELIDFVVGKIMDTLGIEHSLYKRWST